MFSGTLLNYNILQVVDADGETKNVCSRECLLHWLCSSTHGSVSLHCSSWPWRSAHFAKPWQLSTLSWKHHQKVCELFWDLNFVISAKRCFPFSGFISLCHIYHMKLRVRVWKIYCFLSVLFLQQLYSFDILLFFFTMSYDSFIELSVLIYEQLWLNWWYYISNILI